MSPSIPLRLLQTQSDARLLELARAGHERAFEGLVQRYRKQLLSYCRRLLLPEARAEDALQQALLQAWIALRDGVEVRDAKAWLYRIVHNAAISALRRSGYDYVELDESLHGAWAADSDLDRRIAVREALAGLAALPEAQRDVLLRTAVQGESHEQVAAALGLSDGAVRGLIYRARATLRAAATAFTPPPLVAWAARAAGSGGGHPQLAEVVGGAGSAGLLGALLKGGAVVVSAGVLATGATLVQHGAGSSPSAKAVAATSLSPSLRGHSATGQRIEDRATSESTSALFTLRGEDRRARPEHITRASSKGARHGGSELRSDHGRDGPDRSAGDGADGRSGGPSPSASGLDGSGSGHDSSPGGGGPSPSGSSGDHSSGSGAVGSVGSPSTSSSGDGGHGGPGPSGSGDALAQPAAPLEVQSSGDGLSSGRSRDGSVPESTGSAAPPSARVEPER